jgi:cell pole-organizing protein PopZ
VILKIVGGLLLLVVLAGGGAFVLAKQQPSVANGLAPVVASAQAAQSFDAKVDTLKAAQAEAQKTGKAQPVEIAFTEQELTSKADQASGVIGDSGIAATETQIHLSGGNVIATSSITVQGFSLIVGVVATPVVENGQTKIIVKDVQTGALPLPDAVKAQINAAIGQAIDPSKLGLPIDISNMTIVNGQLVVKGTAEP